LLYPLLAAWLPIIAGGLSGFLVLLHEEDGWVAVARPGRQARAASCPRLVTQV